MGFLCFTLLIALYVVIIAGFWKVFEKAGEPGWACLVPIYNAIVMLRIAGKEWWWILLCMIPFVGIVVGIVVCIEIAKRFGKDTGFAIGLALLGPIFFPILGFGSAQYLGGQGGPTGKRRRQREEYDEYPDEDEPPRQRRQGSPPAAKASDGTVSSRCASCNGQVRVPETAVGKKVKCPMCGAVFVA